MTLDEFLDDYVPNVLKPMGGWGVFPYADDPKGEPALIRQGEIWGRCPLECIPQSSATAIDRGVSIGLTRGDAGLVFAAADRRPGAKQVRRRLLAGLGLSESGR
jgi:hypothetical protein